MKIQCSGTTSKGGHCRVHPPHTYRPTDLHSLNRTCRHLEPLAIAANITQASNTRLYHVLTTLANLHRIYSNLDLEEDSNVRDQVLASLEKRWAAADQDPFIAAVILDPFLRGDFLGRHIALTPIGLCNMLKRLHSRVFRVVVDADFQAAFMDYYNKREEFSPEAMGLADWADVAGKKVSCVLDVIPVVTSNRDRKPIRWKYGKGLIQAKKLAATVSPN